MKDPRAAEPATASAIGMAIGRRVRGARTDLGWTLDQLAQRAGVSRRLLVNVEQGSTNPTIGTLLRLSDALGIGLPALVDTSGDPSAPVTVRRAADQTPVWTSTNGGSATMVAGTAPPDICELWDWRLGPGDAHTSEAHRAGTRELLLVLSGTVDL
ncbi:MAG TPA: helix-turn-helix transcriptional regulator, partial [Dermatophilaceae bacterium]|nr:helix-turn-helix transcriptional regulator [Dermatophilaceae bacterium]